MNEEQRQEESKQPETEKKAEASEPSQKIELDAETYNALLDRLDEYEEKIRGGKTGDVVQDLADEGRQRQSQGQQEGRRQVDLDSLTQSQLAEYMLGQFSHVIQPLAVQIESILLSQEISDLDEAETEVFNDSKDEIFNILTENPKLTVKKAVKLAMKDKPKESEKPDKSKDRLLRHLPKNQPHSERPGRVAGAIDKEKPKDRASAAAQAIDDLGIDFNT